MDNIKKLFKENLNGFQEECVHEYIHNNLLKKMIRQNMENEDSDALDLMNLDVDKEKRKGTAYKLWR